MKRNFSYSAGLGAFVLSLLGLGLACQPVDPTADATPPATDPDTGPTADVDDGSSEVTESDGGQPLQLPVDLPDLPAGAQAPWPGDGRIVNGALLKVVHVLDGDTMVVETGAGEKRIRLKAIDAPACTGRVKGNDRWSCDPSNRKLDGEGEYFGVEAWRETRDMIEGKTLRIACQSDDGDTCNKGPYDRTLAWLVLDGRTDLSRHLAAGGFAWTYTDFASENVAVYCRAENRARSKGLGMWANPNDVRDAMTQSTRRWYSRRDQICNDAIQN